MKVPKNAPEQEVYQIMVPSLSPSIFPFFIPLPFIGFVCVWWQYWRFYCIVEIETSNDAVVNDSDTTDEGEETTTIQPSRNSQFKIIKESEYASLEFNKQVYLIPSKWYNAFISWAQGGSYPPGRVDPVDVLCDAYGVLFESMVEVRDFHITNSKGWSMIKKWYNPSPPNQPIFHILCSVVCFLLPLRFVFGFLFLLPLYSVFCFIYSFHL